MFYSLSRGTGSIEIVQGLSDNYKRTAVVSYCSLQLIQCDWSDIRRTHVLFRGVI